MSLDHSYTTRLRAGQNDYTNINQIKLGLMRVTMKLSPIHANENVFAKQNHCYCGF
jgi:hypothetical protein